MKSEDTIKTMLERIKEAKKDAFGHGWARLLGWVEALEWIQSSEPKANETMVPASKSGDKKYADQVEDSERRRREFGVTHKGREP